MTSETTFDRPSAPIGTSQRAAETEDLYDAALGNPETEQAQKMLEQEGFSCVVKKEAFSIDKNGTSGISIQASEGFPMGNIFLQPPLDDETHWTLMNKFIANGPVFFGRNESPVYGRELLSLGNDEEFVIKDGAGKNIVQVRFITVRKSIVCGIKAV